MEILFLVVVAIVVPIGIWILAERRGKEWQRYLAGLFMASCFAAFGAVGATMYAYAGQLESSYYVNNASHEMLTAAIRRMEGGDCEELVDDFKWMRHKIGHPKTDRPMVEEPFKAFAEGRAGDAP